MTSASTSRSPLRRFARRFGLFAVLLVLLVTARLTLHVWVVRTVNSKLNRHGDYRGETSDLDVDLWRGAYRIKGLRLVKRNGEKMEPFLSADHVDFSVQWSGLLHGAIVGDVSFHRPDLNFVLSPTPEASQTEIDSSWQQTLRDLFPFKIDVVQVVDGRIHFKDARKKPYVDLELSGVAAKAHNLTNVRKKKGVKDELVASLEATGQPLGQGKFWLVARIDPFAKEATFDLDASFQDLDLVRLNDFLRAYAKLDVEHGTFSVFAEVAAAQGRVTGYVKPFFKDLKLVSFRDVKDPGAAVHALWEAIAGTAAKLLKNQPHDQLATRIPIDGRVESPDVGVLAAIGNVLKNAFFRALVPQIEGSVDEKSAEKKQTTEEKKEQDEDARRKARQESDRSRAPKSAGKGGP